MKVSCRVFWKASKITEVILMPSYSVPKGRPSLISDSVSVDPKTNSISQTHKLGKRCLTKKKKFKELMKDQLLEGVALHKIHVI